MQDMSAYQEVLADHELHRLRRNGLMALHVEYPMPMDERRQQRIAIENIAVDLGEEYLLVTGDIRQLFYPNAVKPQDGGYTHALSRKGCWGPAISIKQEKILSEGEIAVAAQQSGWTEESLFKMVLELPHHADYTVIERRLDFLRDRGFDVFVDEIDGQKFFKQGSFNLANAAHEAASLQTLDAN